MKHKFTGSGILKFQNRDRYRGHFKNGRFEGTGQFISHAGWQLNGTFKNGEPTGTVHLKVGPQTSMHPNSKQRTVTNTN